MKKTILILIVYLATFIQIFAQLGNANWGYVPTGRNGSINNIHNIALSANDSKGNIYTIGTVSGELADMDPSTNPNDTFFVGGQSKTYLSKFNSSGKLQFIKIILPLKNPSPSGDIIAPIKLIVDKEDNLYFAFNFFGAIDTDFSEDTFIHRTALHITNSGFVKLDSNANRLWSFTYYTPNSYTAPLNDIEIDTDNNLIVPFRNNNTNININPLSIPVTTAVGTYLIYYNKNGQYIKHVSINSQNPPSNISLDMNNNCYSISSISSTSKIIKTSSSGSEILNSTIGGPQNLSGGISINGACNILKINHSNNGDFIISGNFAGTVDLDLTNNFDTIKSVGVSNNYFMVKYASNGSLLWKKQFSNTINLKNGLFDASNNFNVVGDFKNNLSWGNVNITGTNNAIGFCFKIDNTGNLISHQTFGEEILLENLLFLNSTKTMVSGKVKNTQDIDPTNATYNLTSSAYFKSFWGVYSSNNSSKINFTNNNKPIVVYPNPAINSISIDLKNIEDLNYFIYSIDGKLQLSGNFDANTIDVSDLQNGIYILKTNLNNQSKFIIQK